MKENAAIIQEHINKIADFSKIFTYQDFTALLDELDAQSY